jgi:hypothetical protein
LRVVMDRGGLPQSTPKARILQGSGCNLHGWERPSMSVNAAGNVPRAWGAGENRGASIV